jgi:hypothetical protein
MRTLRGAPLALASCLSLLGACGPLDDGPVGEAPVDESPDGGAPTEPSGVDPDALELGRLARLTLTGGDEVTGEVVATYDHSRWWSQPTAERTWAIFDASAYAAWPDDRSFRFVKASSIEHAQLDTVVGAPYRERIRELGMLLERSPLDGVSWVITGHDSYHLEENGGGDFAWDLVRTDDNRRTFDGYGGDNADFYVWGSSVYLPAGGTVVAARDDLPDNTPGTSAALSFELPCGSNNCVGLHLGGNFYLYLLHLRQGSIPDGVALDMALPAGTLVGEVGNSGVSLEPHLHLSLLWYDEDVGHSWSVPAEYAALWHSRDNSDAQRTEHYDPATGDYVSDEAF